MHLKLDLKIFLFLLLFLLTSQFEIYIIIMIFAIIHELGHLIAGLILGFKVEEIKLTPMGVRLQFKVESEEYNKKVKKGNMLVKKGNMLNVKKAIIALAGPITNIIIFTILILIQNLDLYFTQTYIYQIIVYSNILIAIFNMIPIYPMDGGRFISEILKIKIGYKKAYKITYLLSKTILIILTAISSVAILYLKNIAIFFIIMYLWFLEIQEIRRYNKRKNIEKIVEEVENKRHNMV